MARTRNARPKFCTECGATDWPDNNRLSQCSGRCQQLASRRRNGGVCKLVIECEGCGAHVDISPKHGERKKRSDTKYCDDCSRLKRLRALRGTGLEVQDIVHLPRDCGICGGAIDFALQYPEPMGPSLDHIVPLALGGTNDPGNLQFAHISCNQRKHLRPDDADYGLAERQALYGSRRWRDFSKAFREKHPRCKTCDTPSEATDHVIPVADGIDPWDESNLQALCRTCHAVKSQAEYRKRWSPWPSSWPKPM